MRLLLAVLLAGSCCAETIHFGVKGGVFLTDWHEIFNGRNYYEDRSGRYVVGPAVEIPLVNRVAIEADALYRREGRYSASGIPGFAFTSVEKANSWEFPILLKYRLRERVFRPFAVIGPSFRYVGAQHVTGTCTGSLCGSSEGSQTFDRNQFVTVGLAAGGGAEFRAGIARLSAEMRYVRVGSGTNDSAGSQIRTGQNQLAVLFGIVF
jgi:hypothetical protein